MRVLVDGAVFENNWQRGIRRYMHELLRRVRTPYTLLLQNTVDGDLPDGCDLIAPLPSCRRWRLWERVGFELKRRGRQERIAVHDVQHSSYFRRADVPGLPSVVVVYDMVSELLPEEYPADVNALVDEKRKAIEAATAIITISEATLRDLHEVYPRTRERTSVVHLGSEHLLARTMRKDDGRPTSVDAPYALFVGERAGYKNFRALLDAMTECVWPASLRVKLAGSPFGESEVLDIKRRGLQARIEHCGCVSNERLAELYMSASVFVFPSMLEGFGLPLLEAQAFGVPVAASDIPVFHEVGGGAFVPFDARDPRGLALAIATACERAGDLSEEGRANVLRFSWDETARLTEDVWRSVAGGRLRS